MEKIYFPVKYHPVKSNVCGNGILKMSICDSGIDRKVEGMQVSIKIDDSHPLIKLANFIPWSVLFDLVFPDLKNSTVKGFWWLGRKLKVRAHLGAYILQQMFNKTDRQIEYDIKDNAVYQLFCGKGIVNKWNAPDHTKIEEFRSRLSPETQRKISNLLAEYAVKSGYADYRNIDIDSTVQEANITYPTEAKMLVKLASLAKKISGFMDKAINDFSYSLIGSFSVNLKKIKGIYKSYVFNSKKMDDLKKSLN